VNNVALSSINRNFVKNTAAVSWQIRSKQWGLICQDCQDYQET
jgi:hypothetical protein